jgi:hypothetical protein
MPFLSTLFNDALNRETMNFGDEMNDERERIWNEGIIA